MMRHGGIGALLVLLNDGHLEAWPSATHTLHMLCSSTPAAALLIMQAGTPAQPHTVPSGTSGHITVCSHSRGCQFDTPMSGAVPGFVYLLSGTGLPVPKDLYKVSTAGIAEQVECGAGGVIALMHACSGSPAELQIATLTVLRQLVVQPTGPDAFSVARAVPLLAMLQHSLVAEIRILATKILDRISASSSIAEEAIAEEQLVQVRSLARNSLSVHACMQAMSKAVPVWLQIWICSCGISQPACV